MTSFSVLEAILGLGAAVAFAPSLVLFVQVLAATAHSTRISTEGQASRPRVAVLIPAHNEAAVILPTLRLVLKAIGPGDRAVVVADNCNDDTAALACSEGAVVIERHNLEQRGKSYALEHGLRSLASDPPDIVIVVDADCEVGSNTIDTLARTCKRTGRPVQALYLMVAQEYATPSTQVAELAWIVKNWVRPLGMHALGLPCQVMGSGIAFPWAAVSDGRVANQELAEDYKLGFDLARAGYPPLFEPAARVTSTFPSKDSATRSQRTRWEHGHLQLMFREAPSLLKQAWRDRNIGLFAMALDLMVPPLALLAMGLATLLIVTAVWAAFGGSLVPVVMSGAAALLFFVAISVAWYGWGRAAIPAASLHRIPLYVLAKLPIYLRFVTRRQRAWLKTERD